MGEKKAEKGDGMLKLFAILNKMTREGLIVKIFE